MNAPTQHEARQLADLLNQQRNVYTRLREAGRQPVSQRSADG